MSIQNSSDKSMPTYARLAAWAWAALLAVALATTAFAAQGSQPAAEGQDKSAPSQPAAPAEGFRWGAYEGRSEIEVGYRWVTTAGNKDMYRSMVNLGEGPKLLSSDISLRSAYGSGGLFDRLDLSMYSWGGDPYNSLRLNLGRSDLYDFRASYRNLNYYNFISSYANPLLGAGLLLGQHSMNVTQRVTDLELRLFPNSRIRPYVGYSRVSGAGPGFSTSSVTGNEFLLSKDWRYASDEYRGGVQLELPRTSLTLEQGYRFSRNDTELTDAGVHAGNNTAPFLGQKVVLDSTGRSYRERNKAPVTKILASVHPFQQLSVTGRYIYSMADVESTMSELAKGNLVSLEDRILYASAADAFNGKATRPMHRGNLVVEFTPFSRLRILNHTDLRKYHVSGDAVLTSIYGNVRSLLNPAGGTTGQVTITRDPGTLLVYDQWRNQTEAEYDFGAGLTARAGYRFTSTKVNLQNRDGSFTDKRGVDASQDTAIVGLTYRQSPWLYLSLAFDYNWTDHALTRTDLMDYGRTNFDVRVGPWKNLSVTGHVGLLTNENRADDIDLSSRYRNYTIGVGYDIEDRINLSLDYGRSNISSDLGILLPQTFQADYSFYKEHTDGLGGNVGINLYRGSRLDFGYRGVLSTGAYPLNYHQPYATLLIPLQNRFAVKTYWQYYGYNEKGASIQDYRGHLITLGIVYRY